MSLNVRWLVRVYHVQILVLRSYEEEKHFLTYEDAKAFYDKQEVTYSIPLTPRIELIKITFGEGEHREHVIERKGYA